MSAKGGGMPWTPLQRTENLSQRAMPHTPKVYPALHSVVEPNFGRMRISDKFAC